MASKGKSGQKFIARNRAPRVQIEYDVEIYGSEKKIQLPFLMGVMADLSGKPTEAWTFDGTGVSGLFALSLSKADGTHCASDFDVSGHRR